MLIIRTFIILRFTNDEIRSALALQDLIHATKNMQIDSLNFKTRTIYKVRILTIRVNRNLLNVCWSNKNNEYRHQRVLKKNIWVQLHIIPLGTAVLYLTSRPISNDAFQKAFMNQNHESSSTSVSALETDTHSPFNIF